MVLRNFCVFYFFFFMCSSTVERRDAPSLGVRTWPGPPRPFSAEFACWSLWPRSYYVVKNFTESRLFLESCHRYDEVARQPAEKAHFQRILNYFFNFQEVHILLHIQHRATFNKNIPSAISVCADQSRWLLDVTRRLGKHVDGLKREPPRAIFVNSSQHFNVHRIKKRKLRQ